MMAGKGRYPWRLGSTSFVFPADITENVRQLAGLVDDIQLLFFESGRSSQLAHPLDIDFLKQIAAQYDLSYSVHLPTDLHLGSPLPNIRQAAIREIISLMTELAPLNPSCFDLHLVREPDIPEIQWLDSLDSSLAALSAELGSGRAKIGIENIDYPFHSVRPLALAHGFSLCLDFGHALCYGENLSVMLADISWASHVHYHGVVGEKDHLAVHADQDEFSVKLAKGLVKHSFSGPITLEVYSLPRLQESFHVLAGAWKEFER